MNINVDPYRDVILTATDRLHEALLRSGGRDQEDQTLLWSHCRAGKTAEVAYAVALGVDPRQVIHDGPGLPDFPNMDVKAAPSNARSINVRENALRHDGWLIAAARLTGPWVELVGWLPFTKAATLPVRPPAPGHTTSYVSIPLAMFTPWQEVSRV